MLNFNLCLLDEIGKGNRSGIWEQYIRQRGVLVEGAVNGPKDNGQRSENNREI